MNRVAVACALILGLTAAGCETTPCDEAVTRMENCQYEFVSLTPEGEDCAAQEECESKCIVAATCTEIGELFDGEDGALSTCIAACGA
jgi:hypothetical protein